MFDVTPRTITVHQASLTYAAIPWDCQYLKNTTVEIKEFSFQSKQEAQTLLRTLKKTLKLSKDDLLFIKSSPLQVASIQILTSLGFYVVEEAVEISFDLSLWDPKTFPQYANRHYRLVPATKNHLPSMKKIAGSAFTTDRYHVDTNIPIERANVRFVGWLETSMNNADEVYAFVDEKDSVAGFFIIAKNSGMMNLRLAAIDPTLVGKGLGKLLYFQMFSLLKKRNDMVIHTQISLNNTAVFNVYTYLVHPKVTRLEIVLHHII